MIPLRILLAGAGAVLALGGGTALAAPALMGSVSHGDSVSGAARSCSQSTGSARGACVSAAAQTGTHSSDARDRSGAGSESGSKPNDTHGAAVSAAAHSCAHGTPSDRDAHGECVSAVATSNSSHAGGH